MVLVSRIGERYLRVDSLCLVQDDGADKADSIKHMDLVYEGATLTNIAASGTDNNAGLPGLHPGSRHLDQLAFEIKPGIRLVTVSPLYKLLRSTQYITSGWTYVGNLQCQCLFVSRPARLELR